VRKQCRRKRRGLFDKNKEKSGMRGGIDVHKKTRGKEDVLIVNEALNGSPLPDCADWPASKGKDPFTYWCCKGKGEEPASRGDKKRANTAGEYPTS